MNTFKNIDCILDMSEMREKDANKENNKRRNSKTAE